MDEETEETRLPTTPLPDWDAATEEDEEKGGPAEVFTIAGSWIRLEGSVLGCFCAGYGSHTCRSSMSLPRNMMYSNTSSRGNTGRSVGLSSVPNERTRKKKKKNEIRLKASFFVVVDVKGIG